MGKAGISLAGVAASFISEEGGVAPWPGLLSEGTGETVSLDGSAHAAEVIATPRNTDTAAMAIFKRNALVLSSTATSPVHLISSSTEPCYCQTLVRSNIYIARNQATRSPEKPAGETGMVLQATMRPTTQHSKLQCGRLPLEIACSVWDYVKIAPLMQFDAPIR